MWFELSKLLQICRCESVLCNMSLLDLTLIHQWISHHVSVCVWFLSWSLGLFAVNQHTMTPQTEKRKGTKREWVRETGRDADFWSCFFPLSFNVSHTFPINSSVFQRSAVWSYSLVCGGIFFCCCCFFYLQHRNVFVFYNNSTRISCLW